MNREFEHLDLVDLLSERHYLVRNITEKLWNDSSDIYISNSEWFIMARIYKKHPTIAYVTKHVDISRQATHKFINEKSEALKVTVEKKIADKIGTKNLTLLKDILKLDWGLTK